jgi:polysaccharide export outer membrane protein
MLIWSNFATTNATANTTMKLQFGRVLAAVLLVLAFSTAAAERRSRNVEPPPPEAVVTYRLQPGDILEISVWKEDDLRREVLVRSDGGMSFPLAGEMMVAGLTTQDIKAELEVRLKEFIPDATVSVSVLQINGNQVYVVGKVNRPGVYKFDRPVDVMQVLSLAGGATEFAGVDDIRILRRSLEGVQHTFEFEYGAVARGKRLEQNIVLRSGDTIVVP